MKATVFRFLTMNNMDDPADLDPKKGECVDLVNVDPDNDGGIATRNGLITGLIQQPVTEEYGGRIYWAIGNRVVCNKALMDADDTDARFDTVIALDDMITMIRRVDGGLYVGTTTDLHFLPGTDPQAGDGFGDVWIKEYGGVILGTGCHIRGDKVPIAEMAGNCCIFATHQGVVVGGPGGQTVNLSRRKVSYAYGLTGKSCVREENGLIHYLFTTSKTNPAYNELPAFTFPVDNQ